jgi:hypothetical protein
MRRMPQLAVRAAACTGIDQPQPGGNAERRKERVPRRGPKLLIQIERQRSEGSRRFSHAL